MIAFIDESIRNKEISLGVFVCRGNYLNAWRTLRDCYYEFFRKYGLDVRLTELKFSSIVNELFKSKIVKNKIDLVEILKFIPKKLESFGFLLGILAKGNVFYISYDDKAFLEKLSSHNKALLKNIAKIMKTSVLFYPKRRVIRLIATILLINRLYKSSLYIIDKNLVKKRELKFINACIKLYGIHAKVKFPQKIEDLGIQIADFIAGYARYSANVIQKERSNKNRRT